MTNTQRNQPVDVDALGESDPYEAWKTIKDQQIFRDVPTYTGKKRDGWTRIVCISDTHSRHREVSSLPTGDLLIHAGDFSLRGEQEVLEDLCLYFDEFSNKFQDILVIAGNHDRALHKEHYLARNPQGEAAFDKAYETIRKGCTYLKDSTYRTEGGLEVYGSPWTPEFFDWAFMLDRGAPIREKWKQIPSSSDIVISHGPPLGRGDHVPGKGNQGCYHLMREIQERIQPRLCVFGHIHEGYGTTYDGTTLYVNASSLDVSYMPKNPAIVIDVPHDESKSPVVVQPGPCQYRLSDLPALCKVNGWELLGAALVENDLSKLGENVANDYLLRMEDAYEQLTGRLRLSRAGRVELCEALRFIHCASFDY